MNRLAKILDADSVKVNISVDDRLGLFAQAAVIVERCRWAGAVSAVVDALIAREQLGSTGLGHGVAIPHCRLKGLKSSLAAVIRLTDGLKFSGPDEEPVTLFIFLFVPELASQEDLELLAEMAELLSDKSCRVRLQEAEDADAVFATIAGWTPNEKNPA